MNKIEVKILNPEAVSASEKMLVTTARLTQSGHRISSMDDFEDLYEKPYTDTTIKTMANLPHPTIQKFGLINVVIVGASRRFLAQITRHQNEVKFMSASLQYSNYSDGSDFTVPYNLLNNPIGREQYIVSCKEDMKLYREMVEQGVSNDEAGYLAPQGLRNVLIMSATPYQWKHMISQRSCRRNTLETRYVMLKIWEQLYELNHIIFSLETTGPFCQKDKCLEGKMCCGKAIKKGLTPSEILEIDFPLLTEKLIA